jgi:hypothetical protein
MTDTQQMAFLLIVSTPTVPSSGRRYIYINCNTIFNNFYFDVRDFLIFLYYPSLITEILYLASVIYFKRISVNEERSICFKDVEIFLLQNRLISNGYSSLITTRFRCSRVLEKLVMKFSAFWTTQSFVTMFTRGRQCFMFRTRWTQSTFSHPIF